MKWVNMYDVGLRKNFDASTKPPPGDGMSFWMREDYVLKRVTSTVDGTFKV
eukprot:CAMPEP_0206196750 /NCGR_PEP_ID=MMETSP0166-20121206/8644_1 /ASSEMBLY_ACC=CAM_ASM_000260 /TAXON_ID=95228 /ORGANISM="Vannella robusta, Strain DIVA3 518/3/11/1/6" /LENGTH=50 /DNA_ID=CAMNT_0053614305 /DNA_START=781 /DNA_END=933 /DNA_ORIENTATION=+